MFEHRQKEMDELIETNNQFRAYYYRHRAINRTIDMAQDGDVFVPETELSQLKKKRLALRDDLERMMNEVF